MLRIMILTLAAVGLFACVESPLDGTTSDTRAESVQIRGLAADPSATVRVEARNRQGNWIQIAQGRAESEPLVKRGEPGGYCFSFNTIVPNNLWTEDCQIFTTELRVMVETATFGDGRTEQPAGTFNRDGYDCALNLVNNTNQNWFDITGQCATGRSIHLFALNPGSRCIPGGGVFGPA